MVERGGIVWWEGDERGYMKFHGDGRGVGRYAKNCRKITR
jgi:hypothetical protein